MSAKVLLLVGTKKGGFILESDARRQEWRLREPVCQAWPINHFNADPAHGTLYAAGGNETAQNRGGRADFAPEKYPETGQCVHNLQVAPGRPERLYQQNHCGVYRSDDGGASWQEITAGLPSQFGFPAAVHPRQPETV